MYEPHQSPHLFRAVLISQITHLGTHQAFRGRVRTIDEGSATSIAVASEPSDGKEVWSAVYRSDPRSSINPPANTLPVRDIVEPDSTGAGVSKPGGTREKQGTSSSSENPESSSSFLCQRKLPL